MVMMKIDSRRIQRTAGNGIAQYPFLAESSSEVATQVMKSCLCGGVRIGIMVRNT